MLVARRLALARPATAVRAAGSARGLSSPTQQQQQQQLQQAAEQDGAAAAASNSRLAQLRERLAQERVEENAQQALRAARVSQNSSKASTGGGLRNKKKLPKPRWLKIDSTSGESRENYERLRDTVRGLGLATVCEEARCPNIGECWGGKEGAATATIMIMGDTCTRACRFCSIKTSRAPPPLDPEEPHKVARAVTDWGLGYVVLTSVDRDELDDQGSNHFAKTVQYLKKYSAERVAERKSGKEILVECLTPDFRGDKDLIRTVAGSGLDVFAHNIETVERLTPHVRDRRAGYRQSLEVLRFVKEEFPRLVTKTSVMLGLGETQDEVVQTMRDCREIGLDVITFGQYLRPTKGHLPIKAYVSPEEFATYKEIAQEMGFKFVASGPLVRSSYKAGELFLESMIRSENNYLKQQ
ncbi:Lipoyl synthase, mitochondrial [Hondaea fermentalgiana]|uniref:Lipoyl synthase, mitochondrial n=1 Tax=Hondaea fermentalgiana TaxID=2315210 RepID=A0A2R5GWK1_9STRA|nr:Lipoyl synthase, mitochondrial [Hondaea fermentalgiana]|eukprot:GBG34709.1 Lipoyl synthase, mitochondrial [Hondaea fermentalgiana]